MINEKCVPASWGKVSARTIVKCCSIEAGRAGMLVCPRCGSVDIEPYGFDVGEGGDWPGKQPVSEVRTGGATPTPAAAAGYADKYFSLEFQCRNCEIDPDPRFPKNRFLRLSFRCVENITKVEWSEPDGLPIIRRHWGPHRKA